MLGHRKILITLVTVYACCYLVQSVTYNLFKIDLSCAICYIVLYQRSSVTSVLHSTVQHCVMFLCCLITQGQELFPGLQVCIL